jgi:hypothetical protein
VDTERALICQKSLDQTTGKADPNKLDVSRISGSKLPHSRSVRPRVSLECGGLPPL